MNLKTIFFMLLGLIFSSSTDKMIEYQGHMIESNTLILKFTKAYAPLLDNQNH